MTERKENRHYNSRQKDKKVARWRRVRGNKAVRRGIGKIGRNTTRCRRDETGEKRGKR